MEGLRTVVLSFLFPWTKPLSHPPLWGWGRSCGVVSQDENPVLGGGRHQGAFDLLD